jgi:hypothetical protein
LKSILKVVGERLLSLNFASTLASINLHQLHVETSKLYHTRDGINAFKVQSIDKYGMFLVRALA